LKVAFLKYDPGYEIIKCRVQEGKPCKFVVGMGGNRLSWVEFAWSGSFTGTGRLWVEVNLLLVARPRIVVHPHSGNGHDSESKEKHCAKTKEKLNFERDRFTPHVRSPTLQVQTSMSLP
jgi:hypothetical protein